MQATVRRRTKRWQRERAGKAETLAARDHDLPSSKGGDIFTNSSAMRVAVRGKEISTTTLEFRMISYMARHQGEAFTRKRSGETWSLLRHAASMHVYAGFAGRSSQTRPRPYF